MTKIQNTFSRGIIDKDSDERFVGPDTLIDSENFVVVTTEGSNFGVGKNVPGNYKMSEYEIAGGKTIGSGKNASKNKIYNFVKGTSNDYIIEYDTVTNTSNIVLQYTTGGVLNFVTGERITNVEVISSGDEGGDLLAWSGDSNPLRIVNIERAKTWTANGFTEDEISVMKPSPIFSPNINLTTSVDGLANNFMKEKFICFAYRYKYSDGFYSAASSWSKVAFEPDRFSLNYQTNENNGMLNLSNAVDIDFNVGPRDVIEVELLFRESNNSTVYVIESFNKEKLSWANDSTQTFQFSKSKIFKVLEENQYFRNFDNVPLSAIAQTLIGNRIAYSNYIEGYDLGVDIDFLTEYVSSSPFSNDTEGEVVDYVDVTTYSNQIDFEEGVEEGGSSPVDQMDFLTNTINISLTGTEEAFFTIEINPKSVYSTAVYDLYIKDGATVVQSWTGLSGSQVKTYNTGVNRVITMYVTSSDGLIYDCDVKYNIKDVPPLFLINISEYDYFAYNQLCFPTSTSYGADLEGDTIIETVVNFDLTGYSFKAGNQIRLNFDLKSSLVDNSTPSVTFFYNITENYTSLTDFITNSSFKNQIEDVFSTSFRNEEISNEGPVVSYQGFLVTTLGSVLTVRTPVVVYTVTEPSTVVEDKNEFYLIIDSDFLNVNENSFSSLHSNRDYEVCLFYLDSKGRKTTSLVCPTNTIHIPAENSIFVNKLKITLNNPPPSWARYYKFGIKQVKRNYETIYGNIVYKDGIYRWIKLVGENKNKVKEGDLLIVKSDYSGPLEYLAKTKVLEISTQSKDFIADNQLSNGEDLIEESGMYMKIKQGDFDIGIDQNSFQSFIGRGKRRYATRSFVSTEPLFGEYDGVTFIPVEVPTGSQIRFYVNIKAYGNIEFSHTFEVILNAQDDYASVKDWWDAEVAILDSWDAFQNDFLRDWEFGPDGSTFRVKPWRDGTASRDIITTVSFDISFSGGTLVFETEPIENLSDPFFETPETYNIIDGEHELIEHTLEEAFNCFCFGNGVESYKIQDTLIGKSFSIDSNANGIDEEGYRRRVRFADITYSGIFNSNTNINKLNEFNLSIANFKDDIEKSYGPIMKIKGQDTNLEVYQEDKYSVVYYGKDLLYNADGTTNLSVVEDVLGQQDTYDGEYGISYHPDSFDDYAFNSFYTDIKRGVVLKKNNSNGLFEISSQGMRNYFKKLFRDNTINHINGKYDQFHDYYLLNIQYNDTEYVTWVYSDRYNGWLGRMTFNPEDMIRLNNDFYSFKNGEIYKHNQQSAYNTFYGVESPSKFSFNFSQEASVRKNYKTIEQEGTDSWKVTLTTDLDNGYINKADFVKKEGVFYAHVRNSNENLDTSLLSTQGIGNILNIDGLTLEFNFLLDDVISVGDVIRNQSKAIVGTVVSKTAQTLTLNAVANVSNGDYVMSTKPQNIENQSLLGYYMKVDAELTKNTETEIFAMNSEVSKSYN